MGHEKKVLFIAYHFPPDGAVGSIRPAKFAKYFKTFGWTPHVLTIREDYLGRRDDDRLRDVSDLNIVRTAVWPTLLELAMNLPKGRLRTPKRPAQAVNQASGQGEPAGPGRAETRGLVWHFKRYLNSLFELPDRRIGWLVPAVWRALRVIRQEGIEVVITSSPPGTTALIGLALAELSDVKVITDFRDPWCLPEQDPEGSRSLLSDKIRLALERKIVEASTYVVSTTKQNTERLQTLHSAVPGDKYRLIWNGYDAQDFQDLGASEPSDKLRFAYLGTFYTGRTPKEFLRALGELVQEKVLSTSEIEVTFTGNVRYAEGERVEDLARSHGLENCVKLQDPVSYGEALREMTNSDVLLLLAEAQYYCIPAKTFEYMAARKKILCIARDGATADIVRETGTGEVVNPDSLDQMKSAITRLYQEHRSEDSHNNSPVDPSNFERQHLARQLLDLVEDVVK